jgi:alpha-glucosidase (family GH31 glycosyl hydrolase)
MRYIHIYIFVCACFVLLYCYPGGSLLVCPVTEASATTVDVYFPTGDVDNLGQNWYHLESLKAVNTGGASITAQQGVTMKVAAPLNHIPVFLRAGRTVMIFAVI